MPQIKPFNGCITVGVGVHSCRFTKYDSSHESERVKTMRRKKNLLSALGIQKENKLGVTMHFSEKKKLQHGKKRHSLLCILLFFFLNYWCLIISEKCVVTLNFLFCYH